jgi:hypothetical protein
MLFLIVMSVRRIKRRVIITIEKNETNNAIIVKLQNVRKHSNADRLMLATVLGTQVIVDKSAKDGDLVIYFDSNLQLSSTYLKFNNLYSNPELNLDTTKKGYFGKNGKVRAQKFRGEMSNGYVAPLESLSVIDGVHVDSSVMVEGTEFTSIDGIEICRKYVIPANVPSSGNGGRRKGHKIKSYVTFENFNCHFDTRHLMRESHRIAPGMIYVEEKIHGTSHRTSFCLCTVERKWYQFWKPKTWQEYRIISGTRRVDHISSHLPVERKEIEDKVAPNLHRGEEIYCEIYGHSKYGADIQSGFTYGCAPGEYKCMLYRVTITTPDGFVIDLDREDVYRRAAELGLEAPTVLKKFYLDDVGNLNLDSLCELANGQSAVDVNTLREGIVVWFKQANNQWTCLKHKQEAFLLLESEQRDKEVGDVEDSL